MSTVDDTRRAAVLRGLQRVGAVAKAFLQNKKGLAGTLLLGGIIVMSVAAPLLAPYDPMKYGVGGVLESPSAAHLFGTDDLGRDVLSRFLYGGRISLLVGVTSGVVATLVATLIGIPAGYYRGRIGRWITTAIDMSLVFPPFILVVVFAAYAGSSIWNIILILSLLSWPIPARTIKAKTLSVRENDFVESTMALGASDVTIMKDEILPNVLPIVFANGILQMVYTILMEAAIGFLGLGDTSRISWGTMLYFAQKQAALSSGAWWWMILPGFGIVVAAFGFILVGSALDEVLNPRLQRRTWGDD
ncbi:ABC transporter permease (plasmid) [Haloferax sp. S1W]|uniref:ABC transporter permease n=1 Tax=Haloferax sp. S1W TaxID=3377110 RepID=UPI0037CCBAD2